MGNEAQQVAVRVCHDELAIAELVIVSAIPSSFHRKNHARLCREHARIETIDVRDLDLEIDAAAEGIFERCDVEAAARSCGFLQHEIRTPQVEKHEALLGPR